MSPAPPKQLDTYGDSFKELSAAKQLLGETIIEDGDGCAAYTSCRHIYKMRWLECGKRLPSQFHFYESVKRLMRQSWPTKRWIGITPYLTMPLKRTERAQIRFFPDMYRCPTMHQNCHFSLLLRAVRVIICPCTYIAGAVFSQKRFADASMPNIFLITPLFKDIYMMFETQTNQTCKFDHYIIYEHVCKNILWKYFR